MEEVQTPIILPSSLLPRQPKTHQILSSYTEKSLFIRICSEGREFYFPWIFGLFQMVFSCYMNSHSQKMILSWNLILLVVLVCWDCFLIRRSDAFGTFGFDVHHRYSDPVKGILDIDDLPEKGSFGYYSAMSYRDRLFHGRSLAAAGDAAAVDDSLIFADGNVTYQAITLGYLHYANVSVGTPSLSFLVALDTGSDLFWLPCDCRSCVRGFRTRSGRTVDFNIYSPNTSSTSTRVPCSSTSCQLQRQCSSRPDTCPYQVAYLSSNTSSNGILVEDVLHLTRNNGQSGDVSANIKFGCGIIQTGTFLDGAAPNGLFGLGMEDVSVPSTLASEGLAANSFSMCFGPDGVGRINFGDKGASDQGETAFNVDSLHPTYNISITQVNVGGNVTDVEFTAIFDSGTSYTYLSDPAYSIIGESFNSQAQENRHQPDSNIPFDYCYDLSPTQDRFEVANVSLTMRGGDHFDVTDPIVMISAEGGRNIYCLALVKSEDVNIIGQNFMTGYRVVFDREKMILGWKASDCYDGVESNTLPVHPRNSSTQPPAGSLEPEATSGNRTDSPLPNAIRPSGPSNHSSHLKIFSYNTYLIVLFSIVCNFFLHSSIS